MPDGGLFVIDHNSAFLPDDLLRAAGFGVHVLSAERGKLNADFLREMAGRMRTALQRLPEIVAELPEEWRYLDKERSVPCSLTLEKLESILMPPVERPDLLLEILK